MRYCLRVLSHPDWYSGGFFVVPLNALLQEQGKQTVGAGNAIAVQNLVKNLAMLLMLGLYSLAVKVGVPVVGIGVGFGGLFAIAIAAACGCGNVAVDILSGWRLRLTRARLQHLQAR
jgi:hypothetical protein